MLVDVGIKIVVSVPTVMSHASVPRAMSQALLPEVMSQASVSAVLSQMSVGRSPASDEKVPGTFSSEAGLRPTYSLECAKSDNSEPRMIESSTPYMYALTQLQVQLADAYAPREALRLAFPPRSGTQVGVVPSTRFCVQKKRV